MIIIRKDKVLNIRRLKKNDKTRTSKNVPKYIIGENKF